MGVGAGILMASSSRSSTLLLASTCHSGVVDVVLVVPEGAGLDVEVERRRWWWQEKAKLRVITSGADSVDERCCTTTT